jgi:hypothetical protein
LLPQSTKPTLRWELPQFDVFRASYRQAIAITTLVHIREGTGEIYPGDSLAQSLTVLDRDGRPVTTRQFRPAITPVDIEFVGDRAYLGSIGDLLAQRASTAEPAHVSVLSLADGGVADATSQPVLEDLFRMADIEEADLSGDGLESIIVAGFGSFTGGVAWFEALGSNDYQEHVLLPLPGAVKTKAHDFNGDGLMDALVVNGDNVDSDPYNALKNYHGVRIYLNRGDYDFEEAYFYPMYGAYIAKSADFDADGDLDIAAISFYPDYDSSEREEFAYLENQGGPEFVAYSDEEVMQGRWMTMDVGDIDGVPRALPGTRSGRAVRADPEEHAELRILGQREDSRLSVPVFRRVWFCRFSTDRVYTRRQQSY